jgi:hypothetical protein
MHVSMVSDDEINFYLFKIKKQIIIEDRKQYNKTFQGQSVKL